LKVIFLSLIVVTFLFSSMAGIWKVFSKAGIPGYLAFIPIVNLFFLCKVANKEWYTGFLFFIPFINLLFCFLIFSEIAKSYGRGSGFALGMVFLPMFFIPVLGFMADPMKELDQVLESLSDVGEEVA